MALLQIRSTPISPRLSSPSVLLFNRFTGCIQPKSNRQPVLCGNDESNHIMFLERQPKVSQDINTKTFHLTLEHCEWVTVFVK